MTDFDDPGWSYAPEDSLLGGLQRGMGRAAYETTGDPMGPDLVAQCLDRDTRWDWSVDERSVYLARPVRDLSLPVEGVVAGLSGDDADEENRFSLCLDVLADLGRGQVACAPRPVSGRRSESCQPTSTGGRDLVGILAW